MTKIKLQKWNKMSSVERLALFSAPRQISGGFLPSVQFLLFGLYHLPATTDWIASHMQY